MKDRIIVTQSILRHAFGQVEHCRTGFFMPDPRGDIIRSCVKEMGGWKNVRIEPTINDGKDTYWEIIQN